MRVALVSEHASPLAVLGGTDAGGQNVHVAALARALAARGHRVEVFTRRDDPGIDEVVPLADGVDVVHVPAGPPRVLPKDDLLPFMGRMGAWMARRWSEGPAPDVVHAHFWMSALATRTAVRRLPVRVPTAVTFHALGVVKRRHQGAQDTSPPERLRLERTVVRTVDAVVATCRDEVRELLALGADPRRLHVVPCGVDLDRFTPEGRRDGPWRPGTTRLLCLGRVVERKGVETAIEALVHLPDAELVVAGGPDPRHLADDPDARRLAACAARHGVADRVHLVGRTDTGGAAALLRAADVVVAVPWYEPFGIVPLEAMACGTPVVASAVGGMLDTVEPGATGAHVPPRDPRAVADAVRGLVADPGALARAGRAGAARVRATYGWPRVAAETEAVYERLSPSWRTRLQPVPAARAVTTRAEEEP